MNAIIIAILALLVLVVIAAIFSGKIQGFGQSTTQCESKAKGAHCSDGCPPGEIEIGDSSDTSCSGTESKCCMPMYNE